MKKIVIEISKIGEIVINHFLAKIYKFGSVDRNVGSGRRRSTRRHCAAAVSQQRIRLCSVR